MGETPPHVLGLRLIWPFVFTTAPAIPVLVMAVIALRSPDGWSVLLHPLGVVFIAVGLLLVALPIRLAIYTYSLRQRSPMKQKVWAAIQCAVPGSLVMFILMVAFEQGFNTGRFLLTCFFGSYFVAFVILVAHVVTDARLTNQPPSLAKTRDAGRHA